MSEIVTETVLVVMPPQPVAVKVYVTAPPVLGVNTLRELAPDPTSPSPVTVSDLTSTVLFPFVTFPQLNVID